MLGVALEHLEPAWLGRGGAQAIAWPRDEDVSTVLASEGQPEVQMPLWVSVFRACGGGIRIPHGCSQEDRLPLPVPGLAASPPRPPPHRSSERSNGSALGSRLSRVLSAHRRQRRRSAREAAVLQCYPPPLSASLPLLAPPLLYRGAHIG